MLQKVRRKPVQNGRIQFFANQFFLHFLIFENLDFDTVQVCPLPTKMVMASSRNQSAASDTREMSETPDEDTSETPRVHERCQLDYGNSRREKTKIHFAL
jgi:hypothetical protein